MKNMDFKPNPELVAWVTQKEQEFSTGYASKSAYLIDYSNRPDAHDDYWFSTDAMDAGWLLCNSDQEFLADLGIVVLHNAPVSIKNGYPVMEEEPEFHCFSILADAPGTATAISIIETTFGELVHCRVSPNFYTDVAREIPIWVITVKNDYGS